MENKTIFISSPYSSKDQSVVDERYRQVCLYCAKALREGHLVFSPIAHGHAIAQFDSDLPVDWAFWNAYCTSFINACDELWVLCLDGWDESTGVKGEIEIATKLGKEIKYIKSGEFIS